MTRATVVLSPARWDEPFGLVALLDSPLAPVSGANIPLFSNA